MNKYLLKAIEYATVNSIIGLPRMSAILVSRNDSIFVGRNSRKTHPLAKRFGRNSKSICLHAEIDAIRRCVQSREDTEGSRMYVARVLKNGAPALAKPCKGCQRAIVAFGVDKVTWTE